jgi:hypothetical protein
MNGDLDAYLGSWQSPAPPERMTGRITSLLDDRSLPGPLVETRRRMLALSLAYAAAVATVVVVTAPWPAAAPSVLSHDVRVTRALVEAPSVPASAQSATTAVSAIDLEGFELVARPRILVKRMTP